jgi:glycosyltransferase involved in cell wall biosynthesis
MTTSLAPLGLLIALPTGLTHGGVQAWAVRLASAWASYDTPAAILAHGAEEAVHFRGPAQLAARWPLLAELSREAALLAGPELPTLTTAKASELSGMLPAYCAAMEGVLAASERVLVLPTLLGDCFGLCVAAQRALEEKNLSHRVRVAGFLHSAFAYDTAVLRHFAAGLDAFAGVSEHLTTTLRHELPERAGDVMQVANAVLTVPDEELEAAAEGDGGAGVLRLIYVGRLEDDVKRVGVLPLISEQLAARGVSHTLTIVGDGPALPLLRARCTPHMVLAGSKQSHEVRELLLRHDALLLPSRSEGLSLSMLEAMAAGCCPIVTRTPSGAAEAIVDGSTGLLVVAADAPDHAGVARAFTDVIASTPVSQLRACGERARRVCATRYSVPRQLQGVRSLAEAAFAKGPRIWREAQFAFSAKPSAGADAESRLRTLLGGVLREQSGATLLVHGTGKHTRELAHVWNEVLPRIAAFVEDDSSVSGQELLGKPIITPDAAGTTNATHVVISSRLNQDDIWSRRAVYERQGLRVLKIY